MSLSVSLSEVGVKHLKSVLQCCFRIGNTLQIEATTSELELRVINTNKSACFSVKLNSNFFDSYVLYKDPSIAAAVLLKHLLSAFRTQRIRHMDVEIVPDRLQVTLQSETGLTKTYRIACVEEEHLGPVDKHAYPISLTADARQLNRLLSSFHNSLDEVTLVSRPRQGGERASHGIRLVSYIDAAKEVLSQKKGEGGLHTRVEMDTSGGELFKKYKHSSAGAADATFNLKDLRAMVALCEAAHADVVVWMDEAGTPLLAGPCWESGAPPPGMEMQAELLLATMGESVLDKLPEPVNTTKVRGALGADVATVLRTPAVPTPTNGHRLTTAAGGRHTTPQYTATRKVQHFDVSIPQGLDTSAPMVHPPAGSQPPLQPAALHRDDPPMLQQQRAGIDATSVGLSGSGDQEQPETAAHPRAQPPSQPPPASRSIFSQHVANLAHDVATQQQMLASAPLAAGWRGGSSGFALHSDTHPSPLPPSASLREPERHGLGLPSALSPSDHAALATAGYDSDGHARRHDGALQPSHHRQGQRVGMDAGDEEEEAEEWQGAVAPDNEYAMDDDEECPPTPPDHRPGSQHWPTLLAPSQTR